MAIRPKNAFTSLESADSTSETICRLKPIIALVSSREDSLMVVVSLHPLLMKFEEAVSYRDGVRIDV